MAHLQYMPGDPRLVDQLVYELKSKGIFDQFRKDCISDVDTKPAYQNLRQRVENSVSTFLARQCWQPDLNKNQLREKLRKHILDGNYLEQGVERIVDQVVNPKIASVFIPQVEDLVYNYLGISRKKTPETSNGLKVEDLLPNDLEAVSPGSVNNDDKEEPMEVDKVEESNEQNDEEKLKVEPKEEVAENDKEKSEDSPTSEMTGQDSNTIDKENIPFPQEIVVENIPPPENSPPKVEIEKIELPKETSENIPLPDEMSVDIPLPDEIKEKEKEDFFKPINTDDDDSSSDSSLRRNMSPLTPIRNYNNENSYDAQQAFENDSTDVKNDDDDKKEPSSFRFTIEAKLSESSDEAVKVEKKDTENLSYQFSNQVNINNFNTPLYDDSSNSHMLQIDYESDANSKVNVEAKTEPELNSEDSKKEKKPEEKKSSHKSSHRSRDSHKHSSSSRDKKSESKQSSSRDSSRHDKSKSSKDDKSKSSEKDRSKEKDRSDKKDSKDSKDSSRHRSSHKSSHRDSKSHRSNSSHRHSSKHDDRKSSSSSSQRDKDKSSDKDRNSKDKSKDSRSSSHRSDKDKKSSSSSKNKTDDKDKDKKSKKETDDHYSLSGRGNPNRRSTDRDSNDGSTSSKGSNNPASSKSSQTKADSKRSSKLDTTSTSGDSTSPSDKENIAYEIGTQARDLLKFRPIVRIDKNLETPVSSPPRLPFVPEVILKKPKIAANFEEAKKIMKMRRFLEEEQRRMNQEAALLLEFQANVRPSLSQVYSSVPGPELEFACVNNIARMQDSTDIQNAVENVESESIQNENIQESIPSTESGQDIKVEENTNEEKNLKEEEKVEAVVDNKTAIDETKVETTNDTKKIHTEFFEVTIITEEVSENEDIQNNEDIEEHKNKDAKPNVKCDVKAKEELKYFGEHEKYDAELERAKFCAFFKNVVQKEASKKMYLINCDTYSENVFREASKDFGEYEIVNYHRNGHLKLNKPKTIKNLNTEVTLPVENLDEGMKSPLDVFSPQKSECSFELSSDYNEKLEEMVNKTSRQEIMEIILGSTTDVPQIDYCTESNIEVMEERKRKCDDYSSINNNMCVLKIRKLSTEHITSTTKESPSESSVLNTRSKYLGRPARVGLPKPRRTNIQNSPSSDKSVENYEQNTPVNGKLKRQKVQRYDTSDLYKPKLHYLKRNNIT
ncbi:biorientation of chromosomes in cell division protein 1-like 1 [Aricia agestis]|uniref:biorientation of chromosomes in cell division protein 1-like 1 n=1 Tax=Aricia agestis TaxID=91739 RepID=UPI001C20B39D|nr:biorientation of chromosomes in cell division protein 1-like 1 [Aricia agestis]